MDVYIGFDSAWTDNPKAPGAICAIAIKDRQPLRFYAPQFVSFNQALTFIKSVSADDGVTLIALDQPTVVPNSTGMRPVDRVAAPSQVGLAVACNPPTEEGWACSPVPRQSGVFLTRSEPPLKTQSRLGWRPRGFI